MWTVLRRRSLLGYGTRRVLHKTYTTGQESTSSINPSLYEAKKPKPRFTLGTAFLCTIPVITFGLGTWQVQRLQWKRQLIHDLEDRMYQTALPLPDNVNEEVLDDFEYRRVLTKGRFRHDQEMILGPRTRGDGVSGYFLVTPLERSNGSKILVKRGWIPKEKRDPRYRPASRQGGEVEKTLFTPQNDQSKNEWYFMDVPTMSKSTDSKAIIIEQLFDDTEDSMPEREMIKEGVPVGRSPFVEVRNQHLQYIVTWYGLSAATTVMLYTLLRKPTKSLAARRRF